VSAVVALQARPIAMSWGNPVAPHNAVPGGSTEAVAASPSAQVSHAIHSSTNAAPQSSLAPARLVIELDAAAERFVQTLVDGVSDTVLRRYPNEGQLAFSRGVNAYLAAMARR
jgi:hypothetical protein